MQSDEVKQAAERLRRVKNGVISSGAYDGLPLYQYAVDVHILANAYLASHPADDGEGIDEAWLLSIGFAPESMRIASSKPGPSFALRVDPDEGCDGCLLTQIRDEIPYLMAVNILMPETRGQLRRLCECLGIELKPTASDQEATRP